MSSCINWWLWVMEFFWVRPKQRNTRRKGKNKKTRQDEEKTSALQIEARPKSDPARRANPGNLTTQQRSRAMSHLHRYPPHPDFLQPDREQHCACAYCLSRFARPSNGEQERDAHPRRSRDHAHSNTPGMWHREPEPSSEGHEPCRRLGQHPIQVDQVYVHPYSTHHYHFAVVDHSTICHGPGRAPFPAYYLALVPDCAAVQDIEAVLAHRPGLEAMARLSAEELVPISTFRRTRDLHRASLQLEVWEGDDEGRRSMNAARRG
jgi:hypothetical protein